MKQKFHIKPDGSIGICKAEKRKCKYGGQHFEDFESAQRYADRINSLSRKEKLELYQPFKQTQKEKIVNITKNILKLGSKNEGVEDFHLDNLYVSHTIEITKDNSNGLGFQIKICSTESWDSVKYKIFEKDKYYFTQEIIGDKKVNPLHNLSDNTKKEILSNIHELVKDTDPEIKEELGKNADRFSFSSLTLNHYGQQSDPTDLLEIYYHNGKRNFFATGESKSLKRSFSSTIQEPYKPKPRQLKKVKINNPLLKDEKIYRLTELENLKYNNIEDSQFIIQDKKTKKFEYLNNESKKTDIKSIKDDLYKMVVYDIDSAILDDQDKYNIIQIPKDYEIDLDKYVQDNFM